jgi:hypothetical protein
MTIDLVYTCLVPVVAESRVGEDQTLVIDASLCDPPSLVVDKTTQHSYRGRRKATQEHGRWYEGRISTPWITAENRVYWREFFESVAGDEVFVLDATGFWGFDSDLSTMSVYLKDSNFETPRIGLRNDYQAQFTWRQVDASI